jgi:hypothetical protein
MENLKYINEIFLQEVSDEGELWLQLDDRIAKEIYDYYYISNYGKIYSNGNRSHCLLTPTFNGKGYLQVNLASKYGRITRKIHRLVMLMFAYIPGCEQLEVNHKTTDGYYKTNNRLDNLEWVTPLQNTAHAIETGLKLMYGEDNNRATINNEQAAFVYELHLDYYDNKSIGEILGINSTLVADIVNQNNWQSITYNYDYLDPCTRIIFDKNKLSEIYDYFENNLEKFSTVYDLFTELMMDLNIDYKPFILISLYDILLKFCKL